jgi:uncharacterized protein (DUF697 family)
MGTAIDRRAAALSAVLPAIEAHLAAEGSGSGRRNGEEAGEAACGRALALAPVVWLIGKVQSGKTSIIRAITHSTDAEIGNGFRPSTRTARVYDFPDTEPVLRFLDTRGLGEPGYDPAEDLAVSESSAHLILATMRAMDPRQDAVIEVLRLIRRRHPDWPVVVAQTSLHEAYPPGRGHTVPYPFGAEASRTAADAVPVELRRALAYQRSLLADLAGSQPPLFVPLDLTRPDDGLPPADYGLDELTEALARVAPAGLLAALGAMTGVAEDRRARKAHAIVMRHALAAAGGDLVPVPGAGAVAVSAVQALLLRKLGEIYATGWDLRACAELSAALGAGALVKMTSAFGLRQLAKLIPVYGQTAGAASAAAASFATTYALGKAAVYYLRRRRLGAPDKAGVARVYQDSLREAFRMARDERAAEQQRTARP